MTPDQALQHPLPYDIFEPSDWSEFNRIVSQAIEEDESVQAKYFAEWDDADDRLNGTKVPSGFNTDFSGTLAIKNDPTVSKKDADKLRNFVSVNRTRPNHESVLGDFISSRKMLAITANNPDDRNKARVLQKRVDFVERRYKLVQRLYVPLMDQAWGKGQSWVELVYNPGANNMKGRIEPTHVDIRDVLVDHQAKGMFFDSARRLTRRFKMPIKDAQKKYRKYPLFGDRTLGGDTDYDVAYQKNRDAMQLSDYATFYAHQFRQLETVYYAMNPKDGSLKVISEEAFNVLSADPKTAAYVFEGETEWEYYTALYNKSIGVFHLQYNPFRKWLLIPLINIHSDSRLYNLGDVVVYSNLQDLLDVLVTVFLENAKKANLPIGEVDEQYWEDYKDEIQSVMRHGGAAPGIKNVFNVQPINTHLTMLIPWVISWIQDSISKHSASMGEMPAQQVAKETVQTLIAKDRIAHGRKDEMLNYTLTELADLMVRMICMFDTEPDFFELTDKRPGDLGYIPINQHWTEAEYLSGIASSAGLKPPMQPDMSRVPPAMAQQVQDQFMQKELLFEQQMMVAREAFEQENEVKVTQEPGYLIEGQEFSAEQVMAMIEQSGMEDDEFVQKYEPKKAMVRIYVVNDLSGDPDFSVSYSVDQDYKNDPQFKSNQAGFLHQQGLMGGLDTLKRMDVDDAEGVYKRAIDENQALALAKEIGANPELAAAVQALRQRLAVGAGSNGKAKAATA